MSSAQQAAKSLRVLEPEDWAVMEAMERAMARFESVPLRRLIRDTGYYPEQLKFRLSRINYLGFVMKTPFGYVMNTAGLDLLALHSLVERGLISGMGSAVGMGKESDVFEVINDSGEKSVIKFYRIGRTSFRSTRKSRTYVSPSNQHQWLSINVGAAQKEAEGLTRAREAGVSVPHFLARDRHAVLMSKIDGVMLFRCAKEDVQEPVELFKGILVNLRKAFIKGEMVNGDVSEYISVSHPNTDELLRRDVSEPARFFRKKFALKLDLQEAINYVTGKSKRLKITQI